MKKQVVKTPNKSPETASHSTQDFNFEIWAKQVRPLLLASVSKRGTRD